MSPQGNVGMQGPSNAACAGCASNLHQLASTSTMWGAGTVSSHTAGA